MQVGGSLRARGWLSRACVREQSWRTEKQMKVGWPCYGVVELPGNAHTGWKPEPPKRGSPSQGCMWRARSVPRGLECVRVLGVHTGQDSAPLLSVEAVPLRCAHSWEQRPISLLSQTPRTARTDSAYALPPAGGWRAHTTVSGMKGERPFPRCLYPHK